MTDIWTKQATKLIKKTGELWRQSDTQSDFWAIFDAQNLLQADTSGQTVVIAGSTLTVISSVGVLLTYGTPIERLSDHSGWYVRESLKIDDGLLSRVSIVEATAHGEAPWEPTSFFELDSLGQIQNRDGALNTDTTWILDNNGDIQPII
jgi:hypothetical protein